MDEIAFGRYRLIEMIGEGGMGKVYRAHDTKMRRDVAIKVLAPELATEPGYRERFQREAYTAARLTEPHIVPIYEADEIDDRLYLVMPVIDGTDVGTLLSRDGTMSPQLAVKVIEQMAAALDAAHKHGLVHRDVKPSNALMTADEFVYLIDFGIAHNNAADTRLTRTGSIVGTWGYMAPERFGTGTADARADVYALACVLYECLTGQLPFPGDSLEQQISAHLTKDPPRPTAINRAVPAGFDQVIGRGMAKDRTKRYQTARELATAAHQALTAAPVPAPRDAAPAVVDGTTPVTRPSRPVAPPGTPSRGVGQPRTPASWASQRPPSAPAQPAAWGPFGGVGEMPPVPSRAPRQQPPRAAPRPARRMSWGWTVAGAVAVVLAIALLSALPGVIGPSVSRFAGVQLLILGVLMILTSVWSGATLGFVVLGGLCGVGNIALAMYGSFGLSICGYEGASAYEVWRSHSKCPAYLGPPELEKWAIVASIGVALIVAAAYALRSFAGYRR